MMLCSSCPEDSIPTTVNICGQKADATPWQLDGNFGKAAWCARAQGGNMKKGKLRCFSCNQDSLHIYTKMKIRENGWCDHVKMLSDEHVCVSADDVAAAAAMVPPMAAAAMVPPMVLPPPPPPPASPATTAAATTTTAATTARQPPPPPPPPGPQAADTVRSTAAMHAALINMASVVGDLGRGFDHLLQRVSACNAAVDLLEIRLQGLAQQAN